MQTKELSGTKLEQRDGHFMPLVFVDIAIGHTVMLAGGITVGRQVSQEIDNGKKKFENVLLPQLNYVPILNSPQVVNKLKYSLEDVTF